MSFKYFSSGNGCLCPRFADDNEKIAALLTFEVIEIDGLLHLICGEKR